MKNKKADISLNIIIVAAIALLVLVILSIIFIGNMEVTKSHTEYHDEVIYHCGSHLVRGTEINTSNWDLEDGVDEYYLYEDNYSIEYKIPIHVWIDAFNDVVLEKGENGCKEILRLTNYTKVEINDTKVGLNE